MKLLGNRQSMKSRRVILLLTACLWLLWLPSVSADGVVSLNVDIPAGKFKGIRLKNIPKDAAVAVEVVSNGEIVVALMDSKTYRSFSDTSRPLFLGLVEKRLSFSVTIPATDNYYVVLNNRSGQQERKVKITIRATSPGAGQKEPDKKTPNKPLDLEM
jgi:hypothetical protein